MGAGFGWVRDAVRRQPVCLSEDACCAVSGAGTVCDGVLSVPGADGSAGTAAMSWWLRHIGWWPPLLGAGIKLTWLDKDVRAADVEMRLTPWNRNYVGVHFGGSLFSMTDPFYMLMLAANLGEEYVVWDKAASIRYRKPGKGRVRAEFRLSGEGVGAGCAALGAEGRAEAAFLAVRKEWKGAGGAR